MTPTQQQQALEYARLFATEDIAIDAQVGDPEGFDETPGGVWIKAHVWVPKAEIPGYVMEPPAPAATVNTVSVLSAVEFRKAFIAARNLAGDDYTVNDLIASWRNYRRDPAGHFISKIK